MLNKIKASYCIFILCIYLWVFSDFLMTKISIIRFLDELFALYGAFYFCWSIVRTGKIKLSKKIVGILVCIMIFVMSGILSSFYSIKRPISNVLSDILICIKYWLAIYSGYVLFGRIEIKKYAQKIYFHISLITLFLLVIFLINFVSGGRIQNSTTYRYGMLVTTLFYSIPSAFATAAALLLVISVSLISHIPKVKYMMIIQIVFIVSTLRSKAIIAVALFCVLYVMYKYSIKLNFLTVLVIIGCVMCLGWEQFYYYFLDESISSARREITLTSLEIMKDYFPLGTGYATYGSFYSKVPYSPIYYMYGLNNVWGLSEQYSEFINDTFWPVILGQNGLMGLIFYFLALWHLIKLVLDSSKYNKGMGLAALFSIVYLLCTSMGETAFMNSYAISFGACCGLFIRNMLNFDEG